MTLEEAAREFSVSTDILEGYVTSGFIKKRKTKEEKEYCEEDFESLGLIEMLLSTGFTSEDIKKYLALCEQTGTEEEQIRLLRKQRGPLLDEIHRKQQLLDQLDFLIWNKKKRGGRVG